MESSVVSKGTRGRIQWKVPAGGSATWHEEREIVTRSGRSVRHPASISSGYVGKNLDIALRRTEGKEALARQALRVHILRTLEEQERLFEARHRKRGSRQLVIELILDKWPGYLQLLSFLIGTAALLLSGGIVSRPLGVCVAFLSLSVFCFANYAAWRRKLPNVLFGPSVAVIGIYGSLIIAAAVALGAITGS